ncbi:hypothetical protein [Variovorax sp. GT1P44]|uniref:hypothetical protein n=1 Tax=Variovorax sp. GT1P44 TaxID=3443742 RepID=UPI003F478896
MIHPIFKALLKRPELVVQHLANYVDLLKYELTDVGKGLLVQAVAGVVAAVSLLLALGLTGIAVMLGLLAGRFHWSLVGVPAVAWVGALVGGLLATRSKLREDVKGVSDEIERDVRVLRLAKELNDE